MECRSGHGAVVAIIVLVILAACGSGPAPGAAPAPQPATVVARPAAPPVVTEENWRPALCGPQAAATFSQPGRDTSYREGDTIQYMGSINNLPAGFSVWTQVLEMQTATFVQFDRKAIITASDQPSSPGFSGELTLSLAHPGQHKLVVIMANSTADSIYSALGPQDNGVSLVNGITPGACALGDVNFVVTA